MIVRRKGVGEVISLRPAPWLFRSVFCARRRPIRRRAGSSTAWSKVLWSRMRNARSIGDMAWGGWRASASIRQFGAWDGRPVSPDAPATRLRPAGFRAAGTERLFHQRRCHPSPAKSSRSCGRACGVPPELRALGYGDLRVAQQRGGLGCKIGGPAGCPVGHALKRRGGIENDIL